MRRLARVSDRVMASVAGPRWLLVEILQAQLPTVLAVGDLYWDVTRRVDPWVDRRVLSP